MLSLLDIVDRSEVSMFDRVDRGVAKHSMWVDYELLLGVWIGAYGGNLRKIFRGVLKMDEH
jgi:hypothetical protein